MKTFWAFCLALCLSYHTLAGSVLKPRILVVDGPQTKPVDESKSSPTINSSPTKAKDIKDDNDNDNGFDSQGGLAMINDAQWALNERTPHQRLIITIRFQTATLLVAVYKKNVFELLRAKTAANNTQLNKKQTNEISVSEIDPLHTTPWYYRNKRLLATFIGDESVCWQVKKLVHAADIDHRTLTARQLSLILADKMHEASLSNTIIPCNILVLDLQNLDSFSVDLSGSWQLMKVGAVGFQNAKINNWMETKGRKLAFDILARNQSGSRDVNNNITTENNENSTFLTQNASFNSQNTSFHHVTMSSDLKACFEIFQECKQEMLPYLYDAEKSGNYSIEMLTVHYDTTEDHIAQAQDGRAGRSGGVVQKKEELIVTG